MPDGRRWAPRRGAFFIAAAMLAGSVAIAAARDHVRYVVDGDTFILSGGTHVRLIGVNAPEKASDEKPAEPLAAQARELARRLVEERDVRLAYGQERRDHYGRLLAHVYTSGGTSLEDALLASGLAVTIAVPPNVSRTEHYLAVERRARRSGLGIWSDPYFRPRPAETVDGDTTGFVFLTGRMKPSGRSRRYRYYLLSGRVSVRIAHADWKQYWQDTDSLTGARVVVRGWLTWRDGKPGMRIGHPAMLEVLEQ